MNSFSHYVALRDLFTPIDIAVFFSVLLATLIAVYCGQRRRKGACGSQESLLDYLLMGRQLTLPLFVATLVATWYGNLFGVTQIAFEKGIYTFFTQGVFWYITYLLFALFLAKRVQQSQAVTLPEFVGMLFGPRSAKLSAVFNFFDVLPITYTIGLGLFLQLLFGVSFFWGALIGVFGVALYSLWGGFRAVIFSDLIQFFVMCLSVFLVLVFSMQQFGGIETLVAALPSSYFSPQGGESLGTMMVWAFIALGTLINPPFYQRCFAAQSHHVARRGILLSTLVWIGFDLCTTFGAMYARLALPEAPSNSAYLLYALQILPPGLRGLVLAGVLATILSTLDSYLFNAATTLAYDLAPRRWKGSIFLHHLSLFLVAGIAVGLSLFFEGNIREVYKTIGSYLSACMLFPILFGLAFPGRCTDKQFVSASLLGSLTLTAGKILARNGLFLNLDPFYIGLLTTCLFLSLVLVKPSLQQHVHGA